jgi:prepilin-type N-terminal cleavage/methylation domain-containing protein
MSAKKNQKGYTLLEAMISMVIFLIITTSIYGLLQIGRIDRNRSSRRADILKNARVAMHLIGRDALNAGLGFHRGGAVVPDNFLAARLGLPPDADAERDILTSIIAGNNLFTNDLQSDPNVKTDIIAFAYRDVDFNNSTIIELKNVSSPSGSASTARLQTAQSLTAASARDFDLYLIESDTSQVAVMASKIVTSTTLDVSPNDPLGLNQPFDATGENGSMLRKCASSSDENCTSYLASMKRFFWVSYKVKQDGTLVRILYGNNRDGTAAEQIQEFPLAYNIEDLQFSYVLENGTVTDNPIVGADGIPGTADDRPDDFNLIRQITVTIKVLAPENDEQTGKPESFTISSTFSARNLEYDAG